MPSIYDLWPERWLKAHHLGDARPVVAIESVTVERLYSPRTKREEPRLVVSFYKKQKRLILNKTQATALAAITGTDDYTRWAGHQIVLSAGRTPTGADTIIISPIPDPSPAPAPAAAPAAADDDDDDDYVTDPVTIGDFM